ECHYCGTEIIWPKLYEIRLTSGGHRKQCSRSNLDRMNNDIGYTAENCVVCCFSCNTTKSNKLTYEETVAVGSIRRLKPRVIMNDFGGYHAQQKPEQESVTTCELE